LKQNTVLAVATNALALERVVYDRYRVVVQGSISIKTQIHNSQESKREKLNFVFPARSTERRYAAKLYSIFRSMFILAKP
jgi:hypothetical protein